MLKIRLQRVGRKAEPSFRLVLTDSKNSTKSGRYLEILGNYDARRGEKAEFKSDRITHWLSKGAQASDTVHNLLITKQIITGKKINTLPLKKPIVKEGSEAPTAEAPAAAAPVAQEAVAEVPIEAAPEAVAEIAPEVAPETPAEEAPAEAAA